jgi:hypothetical protein
VILTLVSVIIYYVIVDYDRLISSVFYCITEIAKVRSSLFQINGAKKDPLVLPDAEGAPTTLTEKVYVPVKEHPDVSTHHIS